MLSLQPPFRVSEHRFDQFLILQQLLFDARGIRRRDILQPGDEVKATRIASVLLLGILLGLAGCFLFEDPEPVLNAVIAPEQGIVSLQRELKQLPLDTFAFKVPNYRAII